jgi:DnaK suppressor protein
MGTSCVWNDSPACRSREKYDMTLVDNQRLQSVLRAKELELSRSLRDRDEIAIEKESDDLDAVQLMEERELAIRHLVRNSDALRQIRAALSRIGNGTYGVCQHCEEEISPKRMAAVPWAEFCIACQEKKDRLEIDSDEAAELNPASRV